MRPVEYNGLNGADINEVQYENQDKLCRHISGIRQTELNSLSSSRDKKSLPWAYILTVPGPAVCSEALCPLQPFPLAVV